MITAGQSVESAVGGGDAVGVRDGRDDYVNIVENRTNKTNGALYGVDRGKVVDLRFPSMLVEKGGTLQAGSAWILALATVPLLIVDFIAVRHEEAYLEGKFGAEFTEYTRSVRRWL